MFSRLFLLLISIILLSVPTSASAENSGWRKALPNNLGLLIEKVTMGAKPSVVSVELYSSSRGIERLEGTGYVLSSSGTEIEIMFTAPINIVGVNEEEQVLYVFSATKPTGEIVHFPVKTTSFAEIKYAAMSIAAIEDQIKLGNQELKREDRLAKSEDDRLEQLKGQALQMTGVDDLVELNTELDSLTDVPVLTDAELSRLNSLYAQGRTSLADQTVNETIPELNRQLFQVAKLTTKVDQAERAKLSQHHTDIGRRIAMIRESLSLNSEEIAQEIVRIRARRRELEKQIAGPLATPPPSTDGEF